MSHIISIANQKGGVGKTTTTLSLGAALVERGRSVLLVDLDPQSSLTIACGVEAEGSHKDDKGSQSADGTVIGYWLLVADVHCSIRAAPSQRSPPAPSTASGER